MSRQLPFYILIGTIVAVGLFFFKVIQPFLFPLFFAGTLALLFRPLFTFNEKLCRGSTRAAALLTTIMILLIVMLPTLGVLYVAGTELYSVGSGIAVKLKQMTVQPAEPGSVGSLLETSTLSNESGVDLPVLPAPVVPDDPNEPTTEGNPPPDADGGPGESTASGASPATVSGENEAGGSPTSGGEQSPDAITADPADETAPAGRSLFDPEAYVDPAKYPRLAEWLKKAHESVGDEQWKELQSNLLQAAQWLATETGNRTKDLVVNAFGFVVGFFVMLVALYYFFVDGPEIVKTIHRLSPLDDEDERILFAQFETICRAVVMATLATALIQGGLAIFAFLVVGLESVWLLGLLTVFFSLVPFVGAAAVWVPVTLYLVYQGEYGSAIFMGLWGAIPISFSDNVVKPYLIQGKSKLHPLLVFVSVMGGLQVIGLWGIFLGPIVAAFFYALLNILHTKLQSTGDLWAPGPESAEPRTPAIPQEIQLAAGQPPAATVAGASHAGPPAVETAAVRPPAASGRRQPNRKKRRR
jgi:predicted PurR-regulated permease PerM